jgi:methionyl-tRNA formyltransferase
MSTMTLGPIRRVLLLGGGPLLLQLAERGRAIGLAVDVITSPRHAGEVIDGQPLTDALAKIGIRATEVSEFDQPDTARLIGDMAGTLALSIGAAWIFRQDKIDAWFGGKLFNLHGTRLPQNRGGGGYSWQILMGDRFGFCQIHVVDGGVDTGPILATEEFIFPPRCRVPRDFAEHATERNLHFVGDLLQTLKGGAQEFTLQSQPEYLSSYWPRLHTPTHAWIDWRWQAPFIERFICAFDEPYSGAQTEWNGQVVRLKQAFVNHEDGRFHPFQAGLVYRKNPRWLCIAGDGGSIIVEEVRDENGNDLLPRIRLGDAFATPPERLADHTKRVQFDALGLKR